MSRWIFKHQWVRYVGCSFHPASTGVVLLPTRTMHHYKGNTSKLPYIYCLISQKGSHWKTPVYPYNFLKFNIDTQNDEFQNLSPPWNIGIIFILSIYPLHSLKLSKRTCQEAGPQKETIIFQSHPFSGALAVSFREGSNFSGFFSQNWT